MSGDGSTVAKTIFINGVSYGTHVILDLYTRAESRPRSLSRSDAESFHDAVEPMSSVIVVAYCYGLTEVVLWSDSSERGC